MAKKKYELHIVCGSGEVDEYYSRLTSGEYWESDAETAEEALQEMREYDEFGTFENLDDPNNPWDIRGYWVDEIKEEE